MNKKKDMLNMINKDLESAQDKVDWSEFDKKLNAKLYKPSIFDIFDFMLKPQFATALVLLLAGTFVFKNVTRLEKDTELSIEDEIYIQEMILMSELGEEFSLPSSDQELQEDYQMLSSFNS